MSPTAVGVLPLSSTFVVCSWFSDMSLAVVTGWVNRGSEGEILVVGGTLVGPALCVPVPDIVVHVSTGKKFHKRGRCLQVVMNCL